MTQITVNLNIQTFIALVLLLLIIASNKLMLTGKLLARETSAIFCTIHIYACSNVKL